MPRSMLELEMGLKGTTSEEEENGEDERYLREEKRLIGDDFMLQFGSIKVCFCIVLSL